MRIGIIVDGQAEFRSLARLYARIDTSSTLLNPLYADMQPLASAAKIARASLSAAKIFARRNVDRVIVCLDHEGRMECIPKWRIELETVLGQHFGPLGISETRVVIKARAFENWLVSDTAAFKKCPARFELTAAHENQIAPNKADSADAIKILKAAALKKPYEKVSDAMSLMAAIDPYAGAANSRSFRRFLRVSGCNCYCKQSRSPS